MKSTTVKHMIKNPFTSKRCRTVYIRIDNSILTYCWNTVYHVYNCVGDYNQLQENQLDMLYWDVT